jgi:hypothetical protein
MHQEDSKRTINWLQLDASEPTGSTAAAMAAAAAEMK